MSIGLLSSEVDAFLLFGPYGIVFVLSTRQTSPLRDEMLVFYVYV